MSDRDKKLLIYLGALVILAIAYFLVAKPFLDKIDTLSDEKTKLQSELNRRRDEYSHKAEYEQEIEDSGRRIQEIVDEFPEDNADEKSIMFASHAEADIPIWFNQMKFSEETRNLVKGQESASDAEAAQEAENVAAAEGGSASPDAGDEAAAGAEQSGSVIAEMEYRDTELGLSFETQYDGFKNLLAYIRDYDDRMVIRDLEVTYNEMSGLVSGSMVLSQYALLGPGRELPETETGVEEFGTDNIFTYRNYGGSIIDLLAEMASDFLNKLLGGLPEDALDELGTDYFIKVNAVTDNTNGKTIGRADDASETTFVTSSSNSKEEVTFRVQGSDGDYSVTYKVGKSEYTDEIRRDSGSKLYLRVVSTSRSDDNDSSAVSLHIVNESDMPVVVNIEGDDSNDPRVSVMERTGDVTVNGGQ